MKTFGLISSTFAWCLIWGQGPGPQGLTFEAASVKHVATLTGMCGPGPGKLQFSCNGTLNSLLLSAFTLSAYQAPDLFRSLQDGPKYQVVAKIPSVLAGKGETYKELRDQCMVMLQKLLVERFKLAYHYETKEVQTYSLVVAKGGPKFKESDVEPLDGSKGTKISPNTSLGADGFPVVQPTSGMITRLKNPDGGVKLICNAVTIGQFLDRLALQFEGRPIRDATGLKGRYDFSLVFQSLTSMPSTESEPVGNGAPGLFAALQQQLGLRMVPAKATVRIFVVDRLAKTPTDN